MADFGGNEWGSGDSPTVYSGGGRGIFSGASTRGENRRVTYSAGNTGSDYVEQPLHPRAVTEPAYSSANSHSDTYDTTFYVLKPGKEVPQSFQMRAEAWHKEGENHDTFIEELRGWLQKFCTFALNPRDGDYEGIARELAQCIADSQTGDVPAHHGFRNFPIQSLDIRTKPASGHSEGAYEIVGLTLTNASYNRLTERFRGILDLYYQPQHAELHGLPGSGPSLDGSGEYAPPSALARAIRNYPKAATTVGGFGVGFFTGVAMGVFGVTFFPATGFVAVVGSILATSLIIGTATASVALLGAMAVQGVINKYRASKTYQEADKTLSASEDSSDNASNCATLWKGVTAALTSCCSCSPKSTTVEYL